MCIRSPMMMSTDPLRRCPIRTRGLQSHRCYPQDMAQPPIALPWDNNCLLCMHYMMLGQCSLDMCLRSSLGTCFAPYSIGRCPPHRPRKPKSPTTHYRYLPSSSCTWKPRRLSMIPMRSWCMHSIVRRKMCRLCKCLTQPRGQSDAAPRAARARALSRTRLKHTGAATSYSG